MIWLEFLSSILFKLTIVTCHSHIYNLKSFCNFIYNFKSFLHEAMENNHIDDHKNDWFDTSHKPISWYGQNSL